MFSPERAQPERPPYDEQATSETDIPLIVLRRGPTGLERLVCLLTRAFSPGCHIAGLQPSNSTHLADRDALNETTFDSVALSLSTRALHPSTFSLSRYLALPSFTA